ncbi:MAG: diguanylate cyclase [Planctomycetota bacterium]
MASQKLHLLMIEDSAFDSAWIRGELSDSRLDLEISHATSIEEATKLQSQSLIPFDIVLLDLNLPDSAGLDTLRKTLHISGDVPVVVLTGDDREDLAIDAASIGAHDYLVKNKRVGPVLRKAIHFVVSRQKVLNHLRQNVHVLSIAARLDPLTGLYNRRHMQETVDGMWSRLKEHDESFSVILIDLDHFTEVNNQHGHSVGDEALRNAAVSIASRVRECDTVCRYGGEEFCVLLPNTDERSGLRLAERIRACVSQAQIIADDEIFYVTASLGVATTLPWMTSANDVIEAADQALYKAKFSGRNQSKSYTDQAPLQSII